MNLNPLILLSVSFNRVTYLVAFR